MKSNFKQYILENEAVLNNGYFLNLRKLSEFIDPYSQVPLNLNATLITYNSGNQKRLSIYDTINPLNLSSEIQKIFDLDKNQAIITTSIYMKMADKLQSVNDIEEGEVIIVDRDVVVYHGKNNFAKGGLIAPKKKAAKKYKFAQTPAPLKDRIYGSEKNPIGSAASKKSASKIELSEPIVKTLDSKKEDFNKNHKEKVALNTLKAVMRRGMGAYSKSHRPTITAGAPNSRQAWGFARVNKFLKKKSGEKVKKAYVQDDDLLSRGGKLGQDIICHNCGWEWNTNDSQEFDKYVCHKCGFDNTKYYSMKYAEGGLVAPNGKYSNLTAEQYKLVRTPEFKAWFGDWENDPENASKVVDENGEPMVCYHGTNNDFTQFNKKFKWVTPDLHYIHLMRDKLGQRMINLFVKAENIIDLTEYGYKYVDKQTAYNAFLKYGIDLPEILNDKFGKILYSYLHFYNDEIISQMKELGYDGVKIKVHDKYPFSYSVIDSSQFKLADGTNKTFDSMSDDIRYAEGGDIPVGKLARGHKLETMSNDKNMIAHSSGKVGGVLVGRRHSEGGIKAINKSTGQPLEMEGGEVVITRNAVSDSTKREFEGEMLTNKEILSRINSSGGGVSFADGGEVKCGCNGKSYKYGGKTMTDFEIVDAIQKMYPADFKKGVKEELREHRSTFKKLSKGKLSVNDAAKMVVAKHLSDKPNYYKNYERGGYLSLMNKVIPSYHKFLNMNKSVKTPYMAEHGMYVPVAEAGGKASSFVHENRSNKELNKMLAYETYLHDEFGVSFSKLPVKIQNALLRNNQQIIDKYLSK